MELELEAGGGRAVYLSSTSPAADLGRADLGPSADATVSRRHVALRLVGGGEPRVAFEVVGMNPVVVRPSVDEEKAYRRGEAGELREGDRLSLSLRAPSFWKVRRKGGEREAEVDTAVLDAVARREKRTRERKEKETERRAVEEAMEVVAEEEEMPAAGNEDLDLDEELEDLKIDLENIDPVHEFGFLSMGHEFDNYPKGRIRAPKDWNWFLEEIKKGSDDEDDDEVSNMGRKSRGGGGVNKKKKKKKGEDEDDEWTDVSEDEKDSLQRGLSVKRPKKYVTRSKDVKKPRKESSKTENEDTADEDEDDGIDVEDEGDETLGGFIVQEEDEPMDELSEEEEDEFDDEEEDD